MLKIGSDGCFCVYFFTRQHQLFYTVMSARFQDYNFGITEFVLSAYIAASVVVSILSLLLLILLSSLLFVLVLLLLLLSLYLRYLFILQLF